MNMKRLLVLGLVLLAVISTVSVISAETVTTRNLNVTLDGIDFVIPDGYNAVENSTDASTAHDIEDIDGTPVDSEISNEFKNAAGDELKIEVGSKKSGNIETINLANAEKKNIAGKDGFFVKEVDDGRDKCTFEYLENGKLVKIVAFSEDVIKQVIG